MPGSETDILCYIRVPDVVCVLYPVIISNDFSLSLVEYERTDER